MHNNLQIMRFLLTCIKKADHFRVVPTSSLIEPHPKYGVFQIDTILVCFYQFSVKQSLLDASDARAKYALFLKYTSLWTTNLCTKGNFNLSKKAAPNDAAFIINRELSIF